MGSITDGSEQRQNLRFPIDSGSFAIFRYDTSVLPGIIIDISKGGLAFFYHEGEKWPDSNHELFYLFGERCNVEKVPLIVTYDIEVTTTNHPAFDILATQKAAPLKIRRRGVKFGMLSREQEDDIEELISQYHATGLD